jgi:hypothetical protein
MRRPQPHAIGAGAKLDYNGTDSTGTDGFSPGSNEHSE